MSDSSGQTKKCPYRFGLINKSCIRGECLSYKRRRTGSFAWDNAGWQHYCESLDFWFDDNELICDSSSTTKKGVVDE